MTMCATFPWRSMEAWKYNELFRVVQRKWRAREEFITCLKHQLHWTSSDTKGSYSLSSLSTGTLCAWVCDKVWEQRRSLGCLRMSLRCFEVGMLLKPPQGLSVDLLGTLKWGPCGQCPPPHHSYLYCGLDFQVYSNDIFETVFRQIFAKCLFSWALNVNTNILNWR